MGGIATGFLMSGVAHAQGLRVPDPRLPRTSDGKPNLTAPAPKAPATDPADLLLDSADISQPQIHSLSAIDTLTPQAAVARATTQR